MTSKERFLMAVAHQEPDRVPTGEWEYGSELIDPVLQQDRFSFEGWEATHAFWQGKRNEMIDRRKKGKVELVRKLNWDAVLVHLVIDKDTVIEAPEPVNESQWRFKNGDILQYSKETDRFMIVKRGTPPARQADAGGDSIAARYDPTASELEVVRYVVRELGKTHFIFSSPLLGHPQFGFSDASVSEVENWVRLYEDPDKYRQNYLDGVKSDFTRRGIENAKREGMDGVAMGTDYGCNTGPFMSPDMFKRAVLPGLSAWCDLVHSFGLVALLHSCGNNQALMDMIVEAGVDVYQSIQPEMDIIKTKKRYGRKITLWGGVSAGDLVLSTPDHVKQEAIKYLNECKPGGGYIFGTSHSIMPGAKYENYCAMLEALKKHGVY